MDRDKLPRATHEGVLRIGSISMDCAVLEDGARVISESGMLKAFGLYRSGALRTRSQQDESRAQIPLFMAYKNLQPFIHGDRRVVLETPLWYLLLGSGNKHKGILAESLPLVCEVWLDAREAGVLGRTQKEAAKIADIIIRGLAHVGIIALVDEATGYQYDRERDALSQILDKFVAKEYSRWVKRFPNAYFENMLRLWGWPPREFIHRLPPAAGRITNDLIYERLAPGVLERLRQVNPPDDKGRRRTKHHQWLTEDCGIPELQEHLIGIIAIMRASPNKTVFKRAVNRAFPKPHTTIPIPFVEADEEELNEPPPLKLPKGVKPVDALKALMEVDPKKVK